MADRTDRTMPVPLATLDTLLMLANDAQLDGRRKQMAQALGQISRQLAALLDPERNTPAVDAQLSPSEQHAADWYDRVATEQHEHTERHAATLPTTSARTTKWWANG
jgi:hypothetical protein